MKKTIIIFFCGMMMSSFASAQSGEVSLDSSAVAMADRMTELFGQTRVEAETFSNSPHIDVAKALYGKAAGLNVYQGKGPSASNLSSIALHGHAPLVVIDGFIRDLQNIAPEEIESLVVLKDAASAALYGVRGANGVVLITTRRGKEQGLKIGANYQIGINTQFRSPEFADAYTYAGKLNEALVLDGLTPKYGEKEMDAFLYNKYPYAFPNVNWWNEVYDDVALNHRLNLTFEGGGKRFRYYTVVDYMHDTGLVRNLSSDDRYNGNFIDTRLSIRGNIDAQISRTTNFRLGIYGKISEDNMPNFGSLYDLLYQIPSAAFPVFQEDGIYGGSVVYGANNPYALVASTGNHRNSYAVLLADARLVQGLDFIAKGLSAELDLSFDDYGKMFDKTTKTYRYEELLTSFDSGSLVTTPVIYDKDSETLDHSQGLMSTYLRTMFQGKLKYHFEAKRHVLDLAAIYDQQSYMASGRNKSAKRQSVMFNASYNYADRYALNAVLSYSGTAYLPKGSRFHLYPAVSASWNIHNESFMADSVFGKLQLYASYGLSGWDGNLSHELYLQNYVTGNSYYFTNNVSSFGGTKEDVLPVEDLTVEKAEKVTLGLDMALFENRLTANVEGFFENRSDILVASSSTSGIIGIEVGKLNAGIQEYKGFDLALGWNDKAGDFSYSISANMSYVDSKIIEDNQAYQEYDYLYYKGNRVGQSYGLEAIGFFQDQIDINNSPVQAFGTVRPGDVKYKDQNGDNVINEQDRVKMFGSSIPRCYFGFGFELGYRGFGISANFQGLTGKTISLLDSPLYQPLVNNGTISSHYISNEVSWTPEHKTDATMPRLTTLENKNNYQNSSLWYRDGSFIKLRDLTVSYTFAKSMVRFADMTIYLQGTNLFSLDNIGFADPEQLDANYPSTRAYWVGIRLNF